MIFEACFIAKNISFAGKFPQIRKILRFQTELAFKFWPYFLRILKIRRIYLVFWQKSNTWCFVNQQILLFLTFNLT
jgi:hypothetical protein